MLNAYSADVSKLEYRLAFEADTWGTVIGGFRVMELSHRFGREGIFVVEYGLMTAQPRLFIRRIGVSQLFLDRLCLALLRSPN